MAIDTRDKRASVAGIGLASALMLPLPDGAALSVNDRLHVGRAYRGVDTVTIQPRRLSRLPASRLRARLPASATE